MKASELNILIVDDEELLRSSLSKFFERKGFQVEMAESGNRAFSYLKDNKVDLVLSDVRMPDGDGPNLLGQINAHADLEPVFMFITGFSDLEESELRELGALHIFHKPVDRKEILNKVIEHFQIED